MVTGLELIPIGTVLTIITSQVLQTAEAAKDVLIEKESFLKLSRYLRDVEPVLREMRSRCFTNLTAAKMALEALQSDIERANQLVKDCQDKSKFYLLLNCRNIVKDAQSVTRDLGKDLELLSLAGTELSLDVRDNLDKLTVQFKSAEYQASEAKLQIIDRLEVGIREHRTDQGFANDLIIAIAGAVGVPVEPSEISKELSSFRKEKELLAERKAMQEEAFMEQVINLLSRAECAYTSEVVRQKYTETVNNIAGRLDEDEPMDPLKSFKCPLKDDVMTDPVISSSNQTYEREEIERWFAAGNRMDPVTHVELSDFSLRPNNVIRKSIQEWTERNYCIRIRKAHRILVSKDEVSVESALDDISRLCQENSINKDWIGEASVIGGIVEILKIRNKQLRIKGLEALNILVHNNTKNADEVIRVGGLEQVVRYLAKDRLSELAVSLLMEILRIGSTCAEKLVEEKSAIFYLVMLQNNSNAEIACAAKFVLDELCDKNKSVVVQMAAVGCFQPLISRMREGEDDSKLFMANALSNLESLSEENKLELVEGGAVFALITLIANGSLEAKAAALGALKNISSHALAQQHIAKAGGFPILMDHLTSPKSPSVCREYAAVILKNLSMGQVFTDTCAGIEIEKTVGNLLGLLEGSPYILSLRHQVVQILMGLATGIPQVQDVIRAREGIQMLVALLEGTERELRNAVIMLLYCLSKRFGSEIMQWMPASGIVNLLESPVLDIQAAAAGIIGNIPREGGGKGEGIITKELVDAGAVSRILSLVGATTGNRQVKENALSALLRFSDPRDLELQRVLVDADVHSLLVNELVCGTYRARAYAAEALGDLSMSTSILTGRNRNSVPVATCWSWLWLSNRISSSVCKVHKGVCGVKSSFCIVEAKAVPPLISIIEEVQKKHEGEGEGEGMKMMMMMMMSAEAAVGALTTLVSDDDVGEKGADYLHEMNGIRCVIDLLSNGSVVAKERAVRFLECIFNYRKMQVEYGSIAKLPLVEMATNGSIKKKAGRVLAQLEMIQEASSYFN